MFMDILNKVKNFIETHSDCAIGAVALAYIVLLIVQLHALVLSPTLIILSHVIANAVLVVSFLVMLLAKQHTQKAIYIGVSTIILDMVITFLC